MSKKRSDVKASHVGRSREDQKQYISAALASNAEPTVPDVTGTESTLNDSETFDNKPEYNPLSRRNKGNRFVLHIKESWPSYVIVAAIGLFSFLFLNVNVKIAEINKDIARQAEKIDENGGIVQQLSNDFSRFSAELKSLNDRFDLFIRLMQKDSQDKEKNNSVN
jgi:hypothetical protein